MKKNVHLLFFVLLVSLTACAPPGSPPAPPPTIVALGDSITMGIQDAGLMRDFQLNDYPAFLTNGYEKAFRSGIIALQQTK